MSILKQYKEEHPELAKQKTEKGTTSSVNLPVKCTGYEGEYLLGVRLDTKEDIKIKLMPIEQNTNSKYKRIEISDFENKKSKHHAAPGSAVFIAETCYHVKDNIYNSRWLKIISSDPLQTNVSIFNCSLISFVRGEGDKQNEIIFAKLAFPERVKMINSVEEMESVISSLLNPKNVGSNPFCYVRIKDNETKDIEFVEVQPQRTEREDGLGKKCVEGSESARVFMESNDSKMIRDLIETASDRVSVDIIPGSIVYPGNATKEKMIDAHPNAKKVLNESFYIDSAVEGARPEIGYLNCVFATRKHADGTSYFTYIKPINNYMAATSVKDL